MSRRSRWLSVQFDTPNDMLNVHAVSCPHILRKRKQRVGATAWFECLRVID